MKETFRGIIGRGQRLTSAHTTIVLIAVGVFLVGFTMTSLFARSVSVQNQHDYDNQLLQNTTAVRTQLVQKLDAYNQLLYAASTQFALRPNLTRDDWRNFYKIMDVEEKYNSIVGIGYAAYIPTSQTSELEQRVRVEGYSDFTITPATSLDHRTPILFIEPFGAPNTSVFGFDMFSERNRRDAMMAAMDSGKPVLSRPIKLVQDTKKAVSNVYGSLMYMPVYRDGVAPDTQEARRSSVTGFVYLALRPSDMVSQILQNSPSISDNVNITLTSVSSGTGQNLFEANYSDARQKNQKIQSRDISANGQTWRLSFAGQDQAINQFYGPLGIFFLGAGVSIFIGIVVYSVLAVRLTRVEQDLEADVENTKNELLALASHQLRTPATGVKQYLGILRDGIMGDLTPSQQELVEKAFNTNERQLHVISDLLYVSKVETGQLIIDPVMMDAHEMLTEAIATLKSKADEKNITIVYNNKKPQTITADDRYVRMIVENLISNAIKYSYNDATVKIVSKLDPTSLVIKVADTGVGIDQKDVERIFAKFDRVDNPLSRKEGGSGLGLYLAHQLAKGHGGSIEVQPNNKQGSVFILTLPRVAMIDSDIVNIASGTMRGRR